MSARAPLISVIVPFRNVRPYLDRCIESLLDQTLPRDEYELIFIDNDSTDGGEAIVADHPGIHLLRETRRGAYPARNRGLAEARGEIFAFTDPDCEAEREWLERIAADMRAAGVGILLGRRLAATEHGLLKLIMAYESQKAAYVTRPGVGAVFFGHTNNMAVSRQVMERVGPFPELDRGGDTVLVHRATEIYGRSILRYRPEIRVRHLEIDTLRSYYHKNWKYGRSNERIRELVQFRPLTTVERWWIFRETVDEQEWSPFRGALLLASLIPGMLLYEASRFLARIRRRIERASTWTSR